VSINLLELALLVFVLMFDFVPTTSTPMRQYYAWCTLTVYQFLMVAGDITLTVLIFILPKAMGFPKDDSSNVRM
jgi:hypothetical protein